MTLLLISCQAMAVVVAMAASGVPPEAKAVVTKVRAATAAAASVKATAISSRVVAASSGNGRNKASFTLVVSCVTTWS
ncbi:hypothetical protein OPT61_g5880 [Boeremia exigua]|uniref:Uncharacterized protein n=1 Tax=Boeremia exigua TaxID=749465 RepID=A0ACC2I8Z0_9PLEO|nr:hypothetical protein OPT61_g5880 [Boeremia exigua]